MVSLLAVGEPLTSGHDPHGSGLNHVHELLQFYGKGEGGGGQELLRSSRLSIRLSFDIVKTEAIKKKKGFETQG